MRAIVHTQSLRKQQEPVTRHAKKRERTALTCKIYNVVIEFNFGPVFEHGLERGTGTFRSFRLRDGHNFVWVHDGVGTLRQGNKKGEGIRTNEVVCLHVQDMRCIASKHPRDVALNTNHPRIRSPFRTFLADPSHIAWSSTRAASTSGSICSAITEHGARETV